MQIMPYKSASNESGSGLNLSPDKGFEFKFSLFSDFLGEQINAMQDAISSSSSYMTSTMDNLSRAAESSRYRQDAARAAENSLPARESSSMSQAVEDINDTAPHNQQMTREDLDRVEDNLKEVGLEQSDIRELEDRIDSDEGLTWGQFVSYVAQKVQDNKFSVELSAQDSQLLLSAFGKMGLNPAEAKQALKDLQNGNFEGLFKKIDTKLSQMSEDSQIGITKSEVNTLVTALKLSQENADKIRSLFSKKDSFSINELKTALGQIKQNILQDKQSNKEVVQSLSDKIAELMGGADDEQENLLRSDRLPQDNSEATLKDSAGIRKEIKDSTARENTDKAKQVAEGKEGKETKTVTNPTSSEDSQKAKTAQDEDKSKNAAVIKDKLMEKVGESSDSKNAANAKEMDPSAKNGTGSRQDANQIADAKANALSNANNNQHAGQNAQDKSFNEFASKVKKEDGTGLKGGKTTAKAEFSLLEQTVADTEASASARQAKATRANISQKQVLNQVKNAFIKNMGNGTKQLRIQLNPEDLGKLDVILQSRNKEISATIRSDNPETAKMLSEHMAQLKESLEQQGLKVAKVEIQTSLPDGQSPHDWQGAKEHNETLMRQEMAKMRSQWRTMGEQGTQLAQEMQNTVQQANITQQGLHVIA